MEKKLVRSRNDRVIAGVCGGVAHYFDIDPTIVRLIWAVFIFAGSFLLYFVALLVMPDTPVQNSQEGSTQTYNDIGSNQANNVGDASPQGQNQNRKVLFGIILVVLGGLALFNNIFHISLHHLWPLMLIVIGVLIMFKRK